MKYGHRSYPNDSAERTAPTVGPSKKPQAFQVIGNAIYRAAIIRFQQQQLFLNLFINTTILISNLYIKKNPHKLEMNIQNYN